MRNLTTTGRTATTAKARVECCMNVMSRVIGTKTPMLRSATTVDLSGKRPNVRFAGEKAECAMHARNTLAIAETTPNRMGIPYAQGQSEGYPL